MQTTEISKEQLEEQYRSGLSIQHQEWLTSPITRQFISLIDKLKGQHVDMLSSNVTNTSLSDTAFRQQAISIKNCDALRKIAADTDTFVTFVMK